MFTPNASIILSSALVALSLPIAHGGPLSPGNTPSSTRFSSNLGLSRPESILLYGNALYVSNQHGGGALKDGIGWIQKLDLSGNVIEREWVDGLNAPKGLAAFGRKLYTADIDSLVEIDLDTKGVRLFPVAGAQLLNDVASSEAGEIYVSDTLGGRVHVLRPGTTQLSLLAENLPEGPNGLWVDGRRLLVAGWGRQVDPLTFNVVEKGSVFAIDRACGEVTQLSKALGHLDGIVPAKGGGWMVSARQGTVSLEAHRECSCSGTALIH